MATLFPPTAPLVPTTPLSPATTVSTNRRKLPHSLPTPSHNPHPYLRPTHRPNPHLHPTHQSLGAYTRPTATVGARPCSIFSCARPTAPIVLLVFTQCLVLPTAQFSDHTTSPTPRHALISCCARPTDPLSLPTSAPSVPQSHQSPTECLHSTTAPLSDPAPSPPP